MKKRVDSTFILSVLRCPVTQLDQPLEEKKSSWLASHILDEARVSHVRELSSEGNWQVTKVGRKIHFQIVTVGLVSTEQALLSDPVRTLTVHFIPKRTP